MLLSSVKGKPFTLARGWPIIAIGLIVAIAGGAIVSSVPIKFVVYPSGVILCIFFVAAASRWPARTFTFIVLFTIFSLPISDYIAHASSRGGVITELNDVLVFLLALTTVGRQIGSEPKRMSSVRSPKILAVGILIFVVSGVLSGIHFGVGTAPSLVGLWEDLKLFTLIGIGALTPWSDDDIGWAIRMLLSVGCVVVVGGLFNLLAPSRFQTVLHVSVSGTSTGVTSQFRSGAIQSIFPNPGRLSFFMAICFAIALYQYMTTKQFRYVGLATIFALTALASLRVKGLVEIAAVPILAAIIFPGISKVTRGIAIFGTIIAIGISVVAFRNILAAQIDVYTAAGSSQAYQPRVVLLDTSIKIANSSAPYGAGFGRFASYPSERYYSPVYAEYGLSTDYGLSQAKPLFITDTSWPVVLGESGWLGFAGYLLALLGIIRWLQLSASGSDEKSAGWARAALVILCIVIIDSFANPTLFDGTATACLGLVVGFATSRVNSGGDVFGEKEIIEI